MRGGGEGGDGRGGVVEAFGVDGGEMEEVYEGGEGGMVAEMELVVGAVIFTLVMVLLAGVVELRMFELGELL